MGNNSDSSDGESTPITKAQLERAKRVSLSSINAAKDDANASLAENPSTKMIQMTNSHLEQWGRLLRKLKNIDDQLCDKIDSKKMTSDQLAKAEIEITKEYDASCRAYTKTRGTLAGIAACFDKQEQQSKSTFGRQSLDGSFSIEGQLLNPVAKLPDIPLPKFDGKLRNFTEWYSLFDSMVHSSKMNEVNKLHFLKSAMVGGEAEDLLKHYPLTDGMYEQALQTVKGRYFNKRAIISEHFRDLLDLPVITTSTLRKSIDKIQAIVRGLNVCGLDTAKLSPLITFIVCRKLPEKLREDWENINNDYSTYPSFEPLAKFLNNRCFAQETFCSAESSCKSSESPKNTKPTKNTPSKPNTQHKSNAISLPIAQSNNSTPNNSNSTTNSTATTSNSSTFYTLHRKCPDCSGEHYLNFCQSFLAKNAHDRAALVRSRELCCNCFRPNHYAKVCRRSTCRKCGDKHNTLLHPDTTSQSTPSTSSVPGSSDKKFTGITSGITSSSIVLLPTAVVNVRLRDKQVLARALIDSCSQVNLVTESFVDRHQLQKVSSSTNIYGVSTSPIKTGFPVPLAIASQYNEYQIELVANVISRIPYKVDPEAIVKINSLNSELELADANLSSSSVDILIGAEYFSQIMVGEKKIVNDLCLEQSRFGWIAIGSYGLNKNPVCCMATTDNILEKFWEIEDISPPKIEPSDREICDAHFDNTHERLPDGRFQVRLPFKSTPNYTSTYNQARSVLLRFEKTADENLRKLYIEFMREYRQLGHMQLVEKSHAAVLRYYIPHLPVWRPDSSTTKLRVVFNASADNKYGPSLNKTLWPGYSVQPELFDQLLKFRTYSIVIVGDISKMYRQIQMHPDDRRHQTILWRDTPTEEIQLYELCTLTYGTSPASFIAQKCLQKIAIDLKSRIDSQCNSDNELLAEVVEAISSEFYMDDLLSGSNDISTAITKTKLIHKTLDSAKFPMRKYVSNSTELLNSLDPSLVEKTRPVEFSSSGAAKILGLQYLSQEDLLLINPKLQNNESATTKRIASSKIASIYDPLGLAMPITIRGKIFLQDLWREGLNWDDHIPENLQTQFLNYCDDISNLHRFKVPRKYSTYPRNSFDLIGFCDASQHAYAAVVYMKSYTDHGNEVTLVCSKSKVAPMKPTTIPRLELLGAVLLAKLISRVSKTLKYDPTNAFVFSDSTIVLSWLKGPASKFEVFVRNRIAFVTATLPFDRWSYIRSADNPADLATRGITVSDLVEKDLWLCGPSFIINEISPSIQVTLPEPTETRKNNKTTLLTCYTPNESIIARFSQFKRLVRVIIIVKTFVLRCRSGNKLAPCVNEEEARTTIYRVSQLAWFKSEIDAVQNKLPLPKRCPLNSIDPFVDDNGILRVGGRLQNSSLSYRSKFPVILHRKSSLTQLLVNHSHYDYYHSSQSFMIGYLQSQWWINGTPSLVKKAVRQCVWCTRMRAETVGQIMGNLPADRTTPSRPFTKASVDFAGPFTIRCTNHRTTRYYKYYAAFFVCLVTRAVHIEAVTDLSTPAFVQSLRRFVARRGRPLTLWSDNATNFIGAKNLLEQYDSAITWKFIPPRSPHHGGIWEAAVKAGKRHLLAITKGSIQTEDEFKTSLHDIEAILNSRPLYRRPGIVNADAIDILTPGHFLTGSHLLHPPESTTQLPDSLWDLLDSQNKVLRSFWAQWKRSYLGILQTRSKWRKSSPNLEIGDVVLLKDDSPPFTWPLGVITSGTPDSKGHLRIVIVRSKGSEYVRAIQKIVKLPIERVTQNSETISATDD